MSHHPPSSRQSLCPPPPPGIHGRKAGNYSRVRHSRVRRLPFTANCSCVAGGRRNINNKCSDGQIRRVRSDETNCRSGSLEKGKENGTQVSGVVAIDSTSMYGLYLHLIFPAYPDQRNETRRPPPPPTVHNPAGRYP